MKNKFIMTLALSLIVVSCTTTNPETGKTQASKTTIGAGAGAAAVVWRSRVSIRGELSGRRRQ